MTKVPSARHSDDGFATLLTRPQLARPRLTELLALPDEPEEVPSGPWLDDPAYEVGAFLLGLRDPA